MSWASFFGGMLVAVVVIGLGVGLWVVGGKKTLGIQSWGHLLLGITAAVVAVALGLQLWTEGGFLAWCWKAPVGIFAAMIAIVACDIGLHGDRTR